MMLKINRFKIVNLLITAALILLPYYLFAGKLYIGGDDTRLMYSYPVEYLKNVVFYSWSNFSAVDSNSATQPLIPLVAVLSLLSFFVRSKIVLSYFAFSLPLIFIFIYFQKFVGELIKNNRNHRLEILAGSLFFVLSPIMIINQLFIFLTTLWSISLLLILSYHFIRYLKTGEFIEIFKSIIWSTFLSVSFFSIPWVLGYVIPILFGLIIISLYFTREKVVGFIRKFIIFFTLIGLSQSFWTFSFIMSIFNFDINSPVGKVALPGYISTFVPTIMSTAIGNIFYPMMNLFQREIAFNFNWKLKDVFSSYYDPFLLVGIIFIFTFYLGIINSRKQLDYLERKIFIFYLIIFSLIVFLFTVNIGPLREVFIQFGRIPGFVMFRNFYDKFAPSFVIIYSVLITLSLVVVNRKFRIFGRLLTSVLIGIILFNFMPVKATVNSPLWTTNDIYKNITIPTEYLDTMEFIKKTINPTDTILSYPFGTSIYTVVKEKGSNNVYLGTSPVKIFSGVNDFSGFFSFNFTRDESDAYRLIVAKDIQNFNKFLSLHNVNYVLETKNIPREVRKSWVYDFNMMQAQDSTFLKGITSKKLYTSKEGNYALYEARLRNTLLQSNNLTFKKINQTKYLLKIRIKDQQELYFFDSYNSGWKLFVEKPTNFICNASYIDKLNNITECKWDFDAFQKKELTYLFKKPIFNESHVIADNFENKWILDKNKIENTIDKSFYHKNSDGSIDVELVMYFVPQLYFYYGSLVSLIVIILSIIFLIKRRNVRH